MDYKKAGVDIEAGYESVKLMKKYVQETMRPEVLGGLGGFSGAFDLSSIKDMEEPVLLSGTDGCGTKVKLAFLMDKHDTIGIDVLWSAARQQSIRDLCRKMSMIWQVLPLVS